MQHYFTLIVDSGNCIEVCASSGPLDGACLGYAIKFAGSWDGWRVNHPLHTSMTKVAIGLETSEMAIAEIVREP